MNFHALSGLIVGLASTLSALLVFFKNPRNLKHQAYALYCVSAGVWGFGYWAWQMADEADSALLLARVLMVGAIFLPITYFNHVVTIVDLIKRQTVPLYAGWILAGFFFLSNFTPYFIAGVRPELSFPFWPKPGLLFHGYLIWFVGYSTYGTILLIQAHQRSSGLQRNRYLLLTLGSIIAHLGGFTTFPLWYGIAIPPNGAILITIYTAVVAYALLKYRLFDVGVAMEQGVTYAILTVLIVLPAYPILLLSQHLYLGKVNYTFSLIEVFLLTLMIFGARYLTAGTHRSIEKVLFKARYDRYATLTEFSKLLHTMLDLTDLTKTIVHSLHQALNIHRVVLYIVDQDKQVCAPLASCHDPLEIFPQLSPETSARLKTLLPQGPSYYIREELEQADRDDTARLVLEILHSLDVEVFLPLTNNSRLIGFCALGKMVTKTAYAPQDLNLLATLTQEAAIALDNARLYEELKRSQALVQRTDRLRSLETIAGGLAHEIRNPLTSIKTFIHLAPERGNDATFLSQFGNVVKEDVARIEQLTKEILDYARPADPCLKMEDINDIVESCLYALRVRPSTGSIAIETQLAPNLPPVLVDRQQIKQVFFNLFFNAVESMQPSGGTLRITTTPWTGKTGEPGVHIEIQDTGSGIAPHDLQHIFDPFFTTKHVSHEHEGTGLGLAIVHQIIQDHHGRIEVHSEVGNGTVFRVTLLTSTQKPSTMSMPQADL